MSATVRLPVRHIPSSAEPFGVSVLAFPFAAAALAAGVSEPDRLLWEGLHPAARTAQITASAVTPIKGLPRRGCRLPMALMVPPSPRSMAASGKRDRGRELLLHLLDLPDERLGLGVALQLGVLGLSCPLDRVNGRPAGRHHPAARAERRQAPRLRRGCQGERE